MLLRIGKVVGLSWLVAQHISHPSTIFTKSRLRKHIWGSKKNRQVESAFIISYICKEFDKNKWNLFVFYVPKLQYDYEARRIEGLLNNFDNLEVLSARARWTVHGRWCIEMWPQYTVICSRFLRLSRAMPKPPCHPSGIRREVWRWYSAIPIRLLATIVHNSLRLSLPSSLSN